MHIFGEDGSDGETGRLDPQTRMEYKLSAQPQFHTFGVSLLCTRFDQLFGYMGAGFDERTPNVVLYMLFRSHARNGRADWCEDYDAHQSDRKYSGLFHFGLSL